MLVMTLACVTCAWPTHVKAQSIHARTSFVFVGNAFSIGTASAGLDAVIHSGSLANDEPWIWLGLRSFAYTELKTVNVGLRTERRLVGNTTKDSLKALTILLTDDAVLPADHLPLHLHIDHLEYSALDLVSVPLEKGPWSLQLRGSLLFAAQRNEFQGTGLGYHHFADNTFQIHMNLSEVRALGGSGWALGGRITYAAPTFRITLDATDALGRLEWNNALIRKGLLNTNNKVFKYDGPPSFAPFIHGKHAELTKSLRPMSNWTMRIEPKGPIAFQAEITDETLVTGTAELSWNRSVRFIVGRIVLPAPATMVGLDWNNWHLTLVSDSINPVSARVFSVQAGGVLRF